MHVEKYLESFVFGDELAFLWGTPVPFGGRTMNGLSFDQREGFMSATGQFLLALDSPDGLLDAKLNLLATTRPGVTMKAYAALFMILIAAMTIPLYPAQADTEAPEPRTQPTSTGSLGDDSIVDDASALARDLGVDRAVAKEILSAQGASHEVRGALRGAAGENFVALKFRATREPALVLTLSGDAIPQAVREVVENSRTQIEIVLENTPPESEFLDIVDRSWAEFSTTPGLNSQDSDPGTGRIVFYFDPNTETNLTIFAEEATRFVADNRITIEAQPLPHSEEIQRRGGNPLRQTATQAAECTQGFSVQKAGGPKGVLTAAHCLNNLQYLPLGGGTWKNMTFKQQVYNDRADYQWHTIGATPLSSFFASSSTDVRPVTGSIPRADMNGDYVCHRGRTTGYSCGTITSITYRTSHCGATVCAALWPRIEGPSLKCAGGDSGGPWFNAYTAYGLHHSGASSGTGAGACTFATFSPIRRIGGADLSLLSQ